MTSMSREEWKSKFNHFDCNQDGTIACQELERVLQYVGFNPTPDDLQKYMEQLDKNHDDGIDFEEFYEFVKTLKDPTGELLVAFKKYDRNNDGFIDKNEFKAIITGGHYEESDLDALFAMVDVNGDGKIEYKEFVEIFTQAV